MKKIRILLISMLVVGPLRPAFAANSDIWNLAGQGIYNAKDMVHVDSSYDLRLYNGDIIFGDNGLTPTTNNSVTTPSTSVGGHYGVKFPITNGSNITSVAGMVVIASTTLTSSVSGSFATLSATNTVLGVVDAAYSSGSVMYYTNVGYAAVLTTGAIAVGDILVSSATSQGRAGKAPATIVVGTVIGKALTAGVAAGDTVLALIGLQ